MTREELKSADTRSLISALQYCGRDSYYATYYDEVVDEITKRLNRIADLEKENAELKEKLEIEQNARGDWFGKAVTKDRRLNEAKEIIKKYYKYSPSCEYFYEDIDKEAEQFLKEE